jgi:hypothetical protein
MVYYFVVGRNEPTRLAVELNLKEGLKHILRDKRMVLIFLAAGSAVGSSYTFLSLLQELLAVYSVSNVVIGLMGMDLVIFGMIGGLVCDFWVRKAHNLQFPIIFVPLIGCAGLLVLCATLQLT